jgi:NAD(P)-dependent dehydrogenase (short-subunit alcohol dehydrogenase family)
MHIKGKVIIVTGAAGGIGRALAKRFQDENAAAVVVCDIDAQGIRRVADEIGGLAAVCDVSDFNAVKQVVEETEKRFGRVDLYCANAGILVKGGLEASDDTWQRVMDINLMAHVHAARACLPGMIARGGGAFLNTVSAAGLLSQIGAVTYTVSKHAALGFAEWLAISHGHQGIQVTVVCPQAVRTRMLDGVADGGVAGLDGVLTPAEVADVAVQALAEKRFLALPHPEVQHYFQHKAADHDRWIKAMQRLRHKFPEG